MIRRMLKQWLDDAFHKLHGLQTANTLKNDPRTRTIYEKTVAKDEAEVARLKEQFAMTPDEYNEFLQRIGTARHNEFLQRVEQQAAPLLSYAVGTVPDQPPFPNLSDRHNDARAAKSASEAVRHTVDHVLGYPYAPGPGEDLFQHGGHLNAAMRHLRHHQAHTKATGRFADAFKPGEEGVYVALTDLDDVMVNGLDRAHARLRLRLTPEAYEAMRGGGYEEVDRAANAEWQEVLEHRRDLLRKAVEALVTTKHPKSLEELASDAGVDFP